MRQELVLLNPGPVNLTRRVRQALTRPDMCHREPEFARLQEEIRRELLGAYGLSSKIYASILITGSGTAAVEAMLSSLIPANGKLLILSNGIYGERMQAIARAHGIANRAVKNAWGEEFEPAKIENVLRKDAKITHIAIVHHETTTGRLNDLSAIGRIAKRYNKGFLADAVSSFGGEELNFSDWGITACAASANKCLHGVAGASFVIAKRNILATDKPCVSRSVYLDLAAYFREQERGSSPFTHAVQVFFAFKEALLEFKQMGGWRARNRKYQQLSRLIRGYAKELRLKQYLDSGKLSCILTAFYLPDKVTYEELHDFLRQRGFVIYAGQGKISKTIFRIANMGTLAEKDVHRLFCAMRLFLCKR